jgi:Tfp pilus assembly protein PilN
MCRNITALFLLIAQCIIVLCINKELFQWILATDEVEDFDTTNRRESVSFRELYLWRIGDEKNFWQMFFLSVSFAALISLVGLQLFRRNWHREEEREERLEELEMISQQNEVFAQEMRVRMENMQAAHKEHCAEFQKQMELLKKAMRRKETPSTDFQNVIDLLKTAKAGDGRCDKLKNQVDLLEKAICAEDKRRVQMKKHMNAMKLMLEGRLPVP